MTWRTTGSADEFEAAAGEYLRSAPARNTVLLTLLDGLRRSGPGAFTDSPPAFGWHEPVSGAADGAFLQTPPFPVLVAKLPPGAAPALAELLLSRHPGTAGLNVTSSDEADVAAAWTAASGGSASPGQRTRLFRLASLVPPDPLPPGAARLAGAADRALLVRWHAAFGREAGQVMVDPERTVTDRLSHDGLLLWEARGQAVAMAARTRTVAGVARVVGVYTPPELRRRGYGGAITTAVSQAAVDAGAPEVVLFTDLANPTSNALYQRLGYRPVEDRVLLRFG